MGKQTREIKKQQSRESGARYLLQLVGEYVHESYKQDEVRKKELYFKCRSDWYTFCDRMNAKKNKDLFFRRDAFKTDVDRNFVTYTKQMFPEISWFSLFLLKRKQHSFA